MRTHALIIALPFLLIAGLAWYRLAPSGVFTVSAGALERSPYVNRLLPAERAVAANGHVTVVDEPVYVSAAVPDGYDTVDVTVEYRLRGQPVLELGVLTDVFAQNYDLRPLENAVIDALDWAEHTVDGITTLSRNGDSVADAARYQIATYHATLAAPYREPQYAPLAAPRTFAVSLRGHHTFATYVKNEPFALVVDYMDMNRTEGGDSGVLRVWNEAGEPVLEQFFDDDGNASDNQEHEGLRTITLRGEGWPEGVYTVELSGTSDIFWRGITTPQRYVTFINRLYIGDDVGYRDGDRRTAFITNAKHLTLETFHADSAEEVTFGGIAVQLPESHEKVRYDIAERGLVEGFTEKGDVKMTGDGLFAVTRDSFFNPYPTRMNVYTDLDAQNVNYILTTYAPPARLEDGWSAATASFALDDVFLQDGSATFLLSAPSIAERAAAVDVRRITLTYRRPPPSLRDMARSLRDWFLR